MCVWVFRLCVDIALAMVIFESCERNMEEKEEKKIAVVWWERDGGMARKSQRDTWKSSSLFTFLFFFFVSSAATHRCMCKREGVSVFVCIHFWMASEKDGEWFFSRIKLCVSLNYRLGNFIHASSAFIIWCMLLSMQKYTNFGSAASMAPKCLSMTSSPICAMKIFPQTTVSPLFICQ